MAAISLQATSIATSPITASILKYGFMDVFPQPIQITGLTQVNQWETVNIGSIIGTSTNLEYALIGLQNTLASTATIGVRAVSTTEATPAGNMALRQNTITAFFVKVTSAAQVQIFRSDSGQIAYVLGFGYSDTASIFTDYIDITPSTRNSNVTVDLTPYAPADAVGAVLYILPGYPVTGAARAFGSTSPNPIGGSASGALNMTTLITAMDSSRRIEVNAGTGTNVKILLRGFLRNGFEVFFNAVTKSPLTFTSASTTFQTVVLSSAVGNPRAYWAQGTTVNAQAWQVRGVGSSYVNAVQTTACDLIPTKTGTNSQVEGYGPQSYSYYLRAVSFQNLPIFGTIATTSGTTGSLRETQALRATVVATSGVTALARVAAKLAATVTTTSLITGTIREAVSLRATVTATSTVTGTLRRGVRLQATVASTSGTTGTLNNIKLLKPSTVATTSTVTATMYTRALEKSDITILYNRVNLNHGPVTGWHTVTVPDLPPGTEGVVVGVINPTVGPYNWGIRAVGSTDNVIGVITYESQARAYVKVNALGQFEFYQDLPVSVLQLAGYYGPNSSKFLANKVDITPAPLSAGFQTVDLNVYPDSVNAIGVIIEVNPGALGIFAASSRAYGSVQNNVSSTQHTVWIVGFNSPNKVIELVHSTLAVSFYIVAWIYKGMYLATNPTPITTPTFGQYTLGPAVPQAFRPKATAQWVEFFTTLSSQEYDIKSTATIAQNIYHLSQRAFGFANTDTSFQVQLWRSQDAQEFDAGYLGSNTPLLDASAITATSTVTGTLNMGSMAATVESTSTVTAALSLTIRFFATMVHAQSNVTAALTTGAELELSGTIAAESTITARLSIGVKIGNTIGILGGLPTRRTP